MATRSAWWDKSFSSSQEFNFSVCSNRADRSKPALVKRKVTTQSSWKKRSLRWIGLTSKVLLPPTMIQVRWLLEAWKSFLSSNSSHWILSMATVFFPPAKHFSLGSGKNSRRRKRVSRFNSLLNITAGCGSIFYRQMMKVLVMIIFFDELFRFFLSLLARLTSRRFRPTRGRGLKVYFDESKRKLWYDWKLLLLSKFIRPLVLIEKFVTIIYHNRFYLWSELFFSLFFLSSLLVTL